MYSNGESYTGLGLEEITLGEKTPSRPTDHLYSLMKAGRLPVPRGVPIEEKHATHLDIGWDIVNGTNYSGFFTTPDLPDRFLSLTSKFTDGGQLLPPQFYLGLDSALFELDALPLPEGEDLNPLAIDFNEVLYHAFRGYVQVRAIESGMQPGSAVPLGRASGPFETGRTSASRIRELLGYPAQWDDVARITARDAFLENERSSAHFYDFAHSITQELREALPINGAYAGATRAVPEPTLSVYTVVG